ncbi:MAG: hypothetical protein JNL50_03620 [Phycisphaerae bacterium]|nr:hypothetical protein [Phycisphaerae bacterium]
MPDGGLGGQGGGGIGSGGGGGGGEGSPESQGAGNPLVTDDLLWRRRAIAAEERLADLEKQLDQARSAIGQAEQRARLEREAQAMNAVDVETVVLLAQAALAGMDAPDVGAALRDLKRRKPFLFRAAPSTAPSAASMAGDAGDPGDAHLARALEEARTSGDRQALLRYLRLRRNA